ncbi:hypothetical protein NSP34_25955, partial [Salmonella enterica]|nr:hypothetical protein [Salmonella enterica]
MANGSVSHWSVAVLIVVLASAFVGLVNGVLVALFKLQSLVVTLGTQTILFGAILLYSKGQVIYDGIPAEFKAL